MAIPLAQFGKDHWSLLSYVEDCCVNGREGTGTLDRGRMRCNPTPHPQLLDGWHPEVAAQWKPEWGTRLHGFFRVQGEEQTRLRLSEHDDWDCLDDLEAAGLLEVFSLVNGFVRMTPAGLGLAAEVRAHKAQGGSWATFVPANMAAAA